MSQPDPPWRSPEEEREWFRAYGRERDGERRNWRLAALDLAGALVLLAVLWLLLARGGGP